MIDQGQITDPDIRHTHVIAAREAESDARAVAAWRYAVEKRLTEVRQIIVIPAADEPDPPF